MKPSKCVARLSKRVIALLVAVVLLMSALPVCASAASYPSVFISYDESDSEILYGKTATFKFTVFNEFHNEKLQIRVYNSSGSCIATSTKSLYNYDGDVGITDVTITMDTASLDVRPGKYTLEYWMEFYSLYQWNTAPNKYTYKFTVKEDVCKGVHSYKKSKETKATCTAAGSIVYKCSRCGATKTTTTSKLGHNYVKDKETKATCTAAGSIIHKCSRCGATKTTATSKLGHNYVKDKETKATCIAGGSIVHKCSRCGANKITTTARLGHNYVMHKVTVEPTCQATGLANYKCTRCSALEARTLAKVAHKYTSVVTLPTETEHGYTTFSCQWCDASYVENYTFPDVRNNMWYYDAVEYAAGKGYFSGYKTGRFGPADNIGRQDFVLVLARIDGVDLNEYTDDCELKDVVRNSYYESAVNWALSTGVSTGYASGKFGVGDKITREQLVTMLYRYALLKGYDVTVSEDAAAALDQYVDAVHISSFAKDAIIWALNKGVIKGMDATHIRPQGSASRAQAAQILLNIRDNNVLPF